MPLAAAKADYDTARPRLPAGMTLSHVIEVIERVGRHIGLGARRREALVRLIRHTAPVDWTSPDRDPVCFRAQQDLAQDLGITDRAMRAHEHALAEIGLAIIDTTANGRRSGKLLTGGRRLGINFRPLIEKIEWLVELDQVHVAEGRRLTVLRLECSAAKRDARQAIEQLVDRDPKNTMLPQILQSFAAWPRRYGAFRTAEALEAHLTEINELVRLVEDLSACRNESSGGAAAKIPAILNTTPKIFESCSGSSARRMTARKRPDTDSSVSAPAGAGRREKRIGHVGPTDNQNDLSWLTPNIVRSIAGKNFRFLLDGICPDGEILTERHIRSAAIMILPDLGISPSAWEDASDIFGSIRAALCVLVIEANLNHPTHPIHKPGGALRAFSRLEDAGKFNLAGSLIGLAERARISE